jgi:hypothetical protein
VKALPRSKRCRFVQSINVQRKRVVVVPEGQRIIAQRFNAGLGQTRERVPEGRLTHLTTTAAFSRPSGTRRSASANPVLKHWAIFRSPSGTNCVIARDDAHRVGRESQPATPRGGAGSCWRNARGTPPECAVGPASQSSIALNRTQEAGGDAILIGKLVTHQPHSGLRSDSADAISVAVKKRAVLRQSNRAPGKCPAPALLRAIGELAK